jgi:hypothetical protein
MKSESIIAALFAVCSTGPMAAFAGPSTDRAASADSRPAAGAVWSSTEHAIHTQETFQNMERALSAEPEARFHALGETAKAAYDAGYYDKAQAFA